VVVGADRYEAGQHALERIQPTPDLFVLDDGFSHLRLFRDLDLLAFPAADPYGGGLLLPTGRLREPLWAAARADAAILTGSEDAAAGDLATGLRVFGFKGRSFVSRTVIQPIQWTHEIPEKPVPSGTRLVAVAAIARPEAFLQRAKESGVEIVDTLTFSDHHDYPLTSLKQIEHAVRAKGASGILTTSKDAVKLRGRLDMPLAELPIRAVPETTFWEWLDHSLKRIDLT
jgi:tetraacyldisaccharide 4'-kinase